MASQFDQKLPLTSPESANTSLKARSVHTFTRQQLLVTTPSFVVGKANTEPSLSFALQTHSERVHWTGPYSGKG